MKVIAVLLMLFIATICKSQESNYTLVEVNVNLQRGLALQADNQILIYENESGNLFSANSIENSKGMRFSVTGQSNRVVIISYDSYVTLLKSGIFNETFSGSVNNIAHEYPTITFKTNTADQTGAFNRYVNPRPFTSGTGLTLSETSNVGKLNLWIGGKLVLPVNSLNGKYFGKLVVTSIY